MPLSAGTRLGPYEIVAVIGAGGMGEVYRARDTRLDRDVALKVAAEQFSVRFEREARAIAALSHPHICTLFDIGPNYLVMELLQGETLAERLRRGAIPLPEIARIGGEVAAALERAHRVGIIHRDLKPANIMLTKSGAKLLDFGLAKIAAGGADLTAVTQAGTVLGTLAYMSPEQLAGLEADARSDIYALGCVLYEMATAQRAFEGVAAVLEPPALDQLVRACVARDHDDRLQSAHDVGWTLRAIAAAPAPVAAARRGPRWWVAVAVAVVIAAGLTWFAARALAPPPAAQLTRFTLDPPSAEAPNTVPGWLNLALSPDGQVIAYASTGVQGLLDLRRLNQDAPTPLAGTAGAESPFFSPDGRWIGFFSGSQLEKIPADGGAPTVLCPVANNRGGAWLPDGRIVFSPNTTSGLMQVSANGGTPTPFTSLDAAHNERTHRWPQALDGGRAILFSVGGVDSPTNQDTGAIAAYALAKHNTVRLVDHAAMARFLPSKPGATQGTLLYVHAGAMFAIGFDAARLRTIGDARPILQGVSESSGSGASQFAVAPDGTLAYIPGAANRFGAHEMDWADRSGAMQRLPLPGPTLYVRPALSPDGRRVALEVGDANGGGQTDIYLYDFGRGVLTRLTFGGHATSPAWSPDGTRVAYRFDPPQPGPAPGVFWTAADGSGGARRLATAPSNLDPPAFSPDGKDLIYGQNRGLVAQPLASDQAPFAVAEGSEPRLSPNGHWIAYMGSDSQVYVQAFPGPGGKWQVSSGESAAQASGRSFPTWSRDGRALYYLQGDALMMVPIASSSVFSPGAPVALFHNPKLLLGGPTGAAAIGGIAPDGRMLLMAQNSLLNSAPAVIRVVLNFAAALGGPSH